MSEQPVLTHGVISRAAEDAPDLNAEELRFQGFTFLPSGIAAAELEALRARLDEVYARQVSELGGEEALARCNDVDVARAPLVYDEAFVDVAANPNLLALVERMLGPNFILMQQNGLLTRPATENYQTRWHRDFAYQHWTSTEPLAINALLALDDFTVQSGATFVLPASHQRGEFPPDDYVRRHERPLEAPAGTFLVLDAMTFHRAGHNVSGGPRRAVNHLIGRPFLAQQFDFAALLGERFAQDDLLMRYLGYRWRPQPDVASWRRKRMTV